MKRFFTKTGIWLLAAAATIAVVLCVVSALSSGTGLLHNALGVIASPFRAAGSAVAGWVGGISQRFEDVETLQQENDELRQQIAELEEQLRQMEPAATENKELRQLLGLRQQRSDLVFEAARVTQRDVSNWASTLVLDRGSQHGVAIGDCAVDSAGNLVGAVTDVGLNWCRLSTVLDTDSQFGARVFRTGETAVAGGDLALMAEGRLRLQYLSDSASLIKGDVIVTSGLGGYYPAGLVIGTVESVQTDDGGLRQQIAELEEQLRQMEPAATENKELRQLLGLRQQRSDLVFEAARVTQRDVSNWASTLVLDRGSQHGVAIGDCAVDSAGNLVGAVTDVGLNWCRLSTVLDTDSQFGARVFRTGETAVAGGDLALMSEGRLRLQYLSDSASLIKGDVIVTSGLGGYYPTGLVIGTVESVQTDDGGLARYAVLSPKCDVAAIQEMFIITDFDVIQ